MMVLTVDPINLSNLYQHQFSIYKKTKIIKIDRNECQYINNSIYQFHLIKSSFNISIFSKVSLSFS